MKKPKLSIVIITLNEEFFLGNLLGSIKKQSFKDYEIIVADADSTDKTRDIAFGHGCIITKGGGYSKGRNAGAEIARGKYLLFLDADCILPDDFLEINLKEFIVSGLGVGTTEVKPLSDKYFDKFFFEFYNIFQKITSFFSPHCVGGSIFARKEVFDKVGGFNEKVVFAENHEFSKKCSLFGFKILPIPIYTSVRRIDREGKWKFVLKYIYAGIYRLFYKEINHEIFEYKTI